MTNCSRCETPLPRDSRFCPSCGTPVPGVTTEEMLASSGSDPTGLLDRLRAALGGEFRILRELGRGGMGRVFLAHEIALERRVAMKVLPPLFAEHRQIIDRFKREARTAGKLSHPHIVSVYQVSERDGLTFFTMPYIAGPSLREVLRHTPRLEVALVCRYLREAAGALGYAHGQGIIHRDIKPENVLLEGSRDGRLLLTDFGIAKALGVGTTLTQPGEMIGTPYYMSPEQCREKENIDGRTDQYSLGLVGYEMLAGRFPFTAESMAAIVFKHLNDEPEPLERLRDDLPEDLLEIIVRAIRKSPDERFGSMYDLEEALDAVQARLEQGDRTKGPAPAPVRPGARVRAAPGGRRRAIAGAAALVLVFGIGGFALWMAGDGGVNDTPSTELTVGPMDLGEESGSGTEPPPVGRGDKGPAAADSGIGVGGAAAPDSRQPDQERTLTAEERMAAAGPSLDTEPDRSNDEPPAGDRPTAGAAADTEPAGAMDRPRAELERGNHTEESVERPASVAGTDDPEADPEADPPRTTPELSAEESIAALLETYRRAVAAHDAERLTGEVYGAPIPEDDERIYRLWFSTTEDLSIALELRDLEITGESARGRVEQRMTFRLARTGELRSNQRFDFEMLFRLTPEGWRLAGIESAR